MADSRPKEKRIQNLALSTRQELCKVLNETIPGQAGDYKTLGAHLGMSRAKLSRIAELPDPADYVLQWWSRKRKATIKRLYKVLAIDMKRHDCMEVLIRDPLFADSEKLQRRVERLKELEEERKKKRVEERKKKEVEELIKKGGYFLYRGSFLYRAYFGRNLLSVEIRLFDLKLNIYDGLCDELNKTAQPSFVTLAGEMGYVRKDILHFKKSSNPADAMLVKWSTNPEHDVQKLIELLKKIRRADLAENLEREVCRIWRTRLVEVLKRMANSVVRLCHLRQPTYDELCHELNRCPQRGFVVLADKMGYVKGEIERFMKSDNPSDAMFQDWEKKSENDVPKLIQLLENAGRFDLAGKLKEEVSIILQQRELSETYKTRENSVGTSLDQNRTVCNTSNERNDGMHNSRSSGQTSAEEHTLCSMSNERFDGMRITPSPVLLEIGELNATVYEKLCSELNKPNQYKDYVGLAGAMNYSSNDVKTFQLKSNPSDALLCDWKTKPGNNILALIKLLRKIGRDDLAEFLIKKLDGKGQLMTGVKRVGCKMKNKQRSKKSRK